MKETNAYSECSHRRDVTTHPALRFDDKDPVPTRGRALFDRVTRINECVQAGITSEAKFGHWYVVGYGGRNVDHRNVEIGRAHV